MSFRKVNMQKNIDRFNPENLKFKDLELFISLAQTLNIRELSRKTNLTPGQISKTVHKIETAIGAKLFNRSTLGLSLSTEGRAILPKVRKVYTSFLEIHSHQQNLTKNKITMASSSFFVSHFMPKIAPKFEDHDFRIIELPPEDYIQIGLRSGFSICIHTSKLDWPGTWVSEEIGEIHYNLFAHKNHDLNLKKRISKTDLESYPFITPIYWTREGLKNGNDQFPKGIKRQITHKTSTAFSAAGIVANSTKHLCYLPSLVVDQFSNIQEVKTNLVPELRQKVYITVKSDEVSQIFYTKLIKEASKLLAK